MLKAIKIPIVYDIVRIIKSPTDTLSIVDETTEIVRKANTGDILYKGPKNKEYSVGREYFNERYTLIDSNTKAIENPVEIEYFINISKDYSFTSSWGEKMIAKEGDIMVMEYGQLSYSIDREVFYETYEEKLEQ